MLREYIFLKCYLHIYIYLNTIIPYLDTRAKSSDSYTGWGRSPGVGYGTTLQYSCPENSMGREAWRAAVHGAAKSQP